MSDTKFFKKDEFIKYIEDKLPIVENNKRYTLYLDDEIVYSFITLDTALKEMIMNYYDNDIECNLYIYDESGSVLSLIKSLKNKKEYLINIHMYWNENMENVSNAFWVYCEY